MKQFLDETFLLNSKTALNLYKQCKDMPIVDFHNHLNPQEIYEDKKFENITEAWLSADHYKWRAMRAFGIDEEIITGSCDPFIKFEAWAQTVENLIGNPLYHWTHLELKRYFGIDTPLSKANAKEIYEKCNFKLKQDSHSIRNLLKMQKVEILCTTDDPIDDLKWHKLLKQENFEIKVLPTFRPENAIALEKDTYLDYISKLEKVTNTQIKTIDNLIHALSLRLDYFVENGCKVSDHSLENTFYVSTTKDEVNTLFIQRLNNHKLDETQCGKVHGYIYKQLSKLYYKYDLVMQLHIGAIRNNSTRLFNKFGKDFGFDSVNDFNFAPQISSLLDSMDIDNHLPKTILYCLNNKDMHMLSTMANNFQSNSKGVKAYVQLGTAWWFLDHKMGMEYQMDVLMSTGLISTFIGMLTDSRSFLSFSRHEYFRRIMSNKIADLIESGQYPNNQEYLNQLVKNISYYNAINYFNFK